MFKASFEFICFFLQIVLFALMAVALSKAQFAPYRPYSGDYIYSTSYAPANYDNIYGSYGFGGFRYGLGSGFYY